MITKDNPSMNSTAETIFLSNSDFAIREQCRVREDNIAHEKYTKECIENLTKRNDQLIEKNDQLTEENGQLTEENGQLTEENAHLRELLKKHGIKEE